MANWIDTANELITTIADTGSLSEAIVVLSHKPNPNKDAIALASALVTIASIASNPNTGRGTLFGSIGFFLEAGKLAIEAADNNFTIDDLAAGAGVVGAALARVPNPLAQVWSKYFIALSIAPATGRAIAGAIPPPDEIDRITSGIYYSLQNAWAPVEHFGNDVSRLNAIDDISLRSDLFIMLMQYYADKSSTTTKELLAVILGGMQFDLTSFITDASDLSTTKGWPDVENWLLAAAPQTFDVQNKIRQFLLTPSRITLPLLSKTTNVAPNDTTRDFMLAGTESGYFNGHGGDDLLVGQNGDDYLDGGVGQDRLIGGAGNDRYVVDNKEDLIIEQKDEGDDWVKSSISYTLGDNLEYLVLLGDKNINGTGNALNNILFDNAGDNTLIGGDGNDRFVSSGGIDTFIGGAGYDGYNIYNEGVSIIEAAGADAPDRVITTLNYTLPDNVEFLRLAGSENINGEEGDDTYYSRLAA